MRRLFFALFISLFAIGFRTESADATSLGRSAAGPSTGCKITARFLGAFPKQGKIVWSFERGSDPGERLDSSEGPNCSDLPARFDVWVWAGSFSTLTQAPVYPVYIEEPKPGIKTQIHIEYREVLESHSPNDPAKSRFQGWFLAL